MFFVSGTAVFFGSSKRSRFGGSHEPRDHRGNRCRSLEVFWDEFLDWHHQAEFFFEEGNEIEDGERIQHAVLDELGFGGDVDIRVGAHVADPANHNVRSLFHYFTSSLMLERARDNSDTRSHLPLDVRGISSSHSTRSGW